MGHIELLALAAVLIGLTAISPNIVDRGNKILPAAVGVVFLSIAGAIVVMH
ncbi:MAG: hypothetical protein RRB13_04355 [bacterium]|nr:hypothetical protein [bacterium]